MNASISCGPTDRRISSATWIRRAPAFTLVELLSVLAVVSVMTVTVVFALGGTSEAQSLSRAAYDVAGHLEHARTYAMANNTYVFVGLAETGEIEAETPSILVATMVSKDGTKDFGTSNSNLAALTRVRRIERIRFDDDLPNDGGLSRPEVAPAYRLGPDTYDSPNSFRQLHQDFTKIVQFDPRGTASLPADSQSIPQYLEIGLAATKGNVAGSSVSGAALVLDGMSGTVKIYRP